MTQIWVASIVLALAKIMESSAKSNVAFRVLQGKFLTPWSKLLETNFEIISKNTSTQKIKRYDDKWSPSLKSICYKRTLPPLSFLTIVTITSIISDHTDKENVPPITCNNSTNKDKSKTLIPHIMAKSFKNMKCTKRMRKRVPLADITNLFNNFVTSITFTLSHQQQQFGVSSALPRRAPRTSKTLRMGFRQASIFCLL